MNELATAQHEIMKRYTVDEMSFLKRCAQKHQSGAGITPNIEVIKMLQREDIVIAESGLDEKTTFYKIRDPLMKIILNETARRPNTTLNFRGLIGNVVEGLIEEIVEALANAKLSVKGTNLVRSNS